MNNKTQLKLLLTKVVLSLVLSIAMLPELFAQNLQNKNEANLKQSEYARDSIKSALTYEIDNAILDNTIYVSKKKSRNCDIFSFLKYSKHETASSGDHAFYVGIPYALFKTDIYTKKALGVSLGSDIYYSDRSFFAINTTVMASSLYAGYYWEDDEEYDDDYLDSRSYFIADEYDDPEKTVIVPLLLNVSNNHKFGNLSIGYGISAGFTFYNKYYEDSYRDKSECLASLSLIFPVYYQLSDYFNLGVIYRPTYAKSQYQYSIGFEIAWKFII